MLRNKKNAYGGKWSKDLISTMQGTPQRPNPIKVGLHIPVRLGTDPDLGGGASGATPEPGDDQGIPPVPAEIPEPLVRRTPITHREVEKYGPTPGCVGCEAKSRGEVTRRGHSEKCRRRMEELMQQDQEDRKSWSRGKRG